jgi:hypothetical protein
VHPEKPYDHTNHFDVPHDPLELFNVSVLVHGVHGGHGVHVLHPEQLYALSGCSP